MRPVTSNSICFMTAIILLATFPQATQASRSTSFFSMVYPRMGEPPLSSGIFQVNLQPVGQTLLISRKPKKYQSYHANDLKGKEMEQQLRYFVNHHRIPHTYLCIIFKFLGRRSLRGCSNRACVIT